MSESFLNGRITLHCGDCLDVLAILPENSIDSCVTDPPYHLVSIVKRFGSPTAKPVRVGDINATNDLKAAHARSAAGFMGKQWDGGDIAQSVDLWRQVYRVLKPGAHLLAFGGDRTFHRMACAIEDAGFEIRGTIAWMFGSGFPKSHDVSKGIDRAAGAKRKIVGEIVCGDVEAAKQNGVTMAAADANKNNKAIFGYGIEQITEPSTDAARQWQGWGTALKPAMELICVARKPLSESTIAANVLKWGTGAINIGSCRIETDRRPAREVHAMRDDVEYNGNSLAGRVDGSLQSSKAIGTTNIGRWPANVIHDGSEEVVGMFPDSKAAYINQESATAKLAERKPTQRRGVTSFDDGKPCSTLYVDQGSAARFFYTAKADADDRLGSKHPTVKPLDLMQYLVRLVTPKGGTVLDPFAGTGTTGEAAWREGMNAVLIEREAEYQADIRRRMKLCLSGPDERQRQSIKAKMKDNPLDHGPLFGAIA